MRAYTISSNDSYLKLEQNYPQKIFHEQNVHPHWFIKNVMNDVKRIKYIKGTLSRNKLK